MKRGGGSKQNVGRKNLPDGIIKVRFVMKLEQKQLLRWRSVYGRGLAAAVRRCIERDINNNKL